MTEITPLISICIANYNGMGVIDDCIRSVLDQKGGLAVEILVHDDASSDGSGAYIRDQYPLVRLIVSDTNVGFCVANNRMADHAKGQYLLLLNNDAALYPDALETLLTEANRINQPAILSLPQYDAQSGVLVDRGCLLDPFFNPVPNLDPNRSDVAMVIGACLWIPKNMWEELGGFPEQFGSVAEDMYVCCRARLAGYAVRVFVASGYWHWQGVSFGGNKPKNGRLDSTFRRRFLSERNKLQVMVLMTSASRLIWLLPLHLLLSLAEALVMCSASFRWDYLQRVYWPAWCEVWQARVRAVRERQYIQRARRVTTAEFTQTFTVLPRKLQLLWKYGLPRLK